MYIPFSAQRNPLNYKFFKLNFFLSISLYEVKINDFTQAVARFNMKFLPLYCISELQQVSIVLGWDGTVEIRKVLYLNNWLRQSYISIILLILIQKWNRKSMDEQLCRYQQRERSNKCSSIVEFIAFWVKWWTDVEKHQKISSRKFLTT